MNRPIRYVALLAAMTLFLPEHGSAEQPGSELRAPKPLVWTSRAHDIPRIPPKPGMTVPTIEVVVKSPESSEVKNEDEVGSQAVVDEDAFLRPTWDPGFWVMPPGGLTRFLWPSPGVINPEETLQQAGGAAL